VFITDNCWPALFVSCDIYILSIDRMPILLAIYHWNGIDFWHLMFSKSTAFYKCCTVVRVDGSFTYRNCSLKCLVLNFCGDLNVKSNERGETYMQYIPWLQYCRVASEHHHLHDLLSCKQKNMLQWISYKMLKYIENSVNPHIPVKYNMPYYCVV
jgi:hypothetical protein